MPRLSKKRTHAKEHAKEVAKELVKEVQSDLSHGRKRPALPAEDTVQSGTFAAMTELI